MYFCTGCNPGLEIFDASRNQLTGSLPIDYIAGRFLLSTLSECSHTPPKRIPSPTIISVGEAPRLPSYPYTKSPMRAKCRGSTRGKVKCGQKARGGGGMGGGGERGFRLAIS